MKEEQTVLLKPLEIFHTSEEFTQMCNINGFKTLGEIVKLEVNEMLVKPEFNLRMLKELYQLLEKYHLEECLKE